MQYLIKQADRALELQEKELMDRVIIHMRGMFDQWLRDRRRFRGFREAVAGRWARVGFWIDDRIVWPLALLAGVKRFRLIDWLYWNVWIDFVFQALFHLPRNFIMFGRFRP
jgi:hypothetical protein